MTNLTRGLPDIEIITRLYPLPACEIPLKDAYLGQDLRQYAHQSGRVFVYANFVASLDGRIAVQRQGEVGLTVPKDTANDRDWRLFQELAAQANLVISSGRYLREWAEGRAQEILQVDDPRFADLREWRANQGLAPLPDIAIISGSMRFPLPDVLTANGRKFVVFTHGYPDPARIEEIKTAGGNVFSVGKDSLDGEQMVQIMGDLGYQTVYSAAGPKILHLLLMGGVLNRLYLTHVHRILGGDPYATIVEGPLLEAPSGFVLNSLYFDQAALDGSGQLFISYDRV